MYMISLGSRCALLAAVVLLAFQLTNKSFAELSNSTDSSSNLSPAPLEAQTALEDKCDAEFSLDTQRVQSLCQGSCDASRTSDVALLNCDAIMLQCMENNGLQEARRIHQLCKLNQSQSGESRRLNTSAESSAGTGIVAPIAGEVPAESGDGEGKGGTPPGEEEDSKGGETADGGSTTDAGYSSEALVSDVNQCNQGSQEAFKCCNAPEQCGVTSGSSGYTLPPTNDPEGMKQYCEQMKYSASRGRSANADAAAVCYSKHSGCSLSCKRSKEKWESYLPNCKAPNCDPAKVQEALNIFNLKVSECNGLQENERLLASQSSSNYNDALASQQCAQQAGIDPSSMMPQKTPEEKIDSASFGPDCSGENATKPECIDCSKYPNSPLCGGGNFDGGNSEKVSKINNSNGQGISMSDFNPDSGADGLPQFPQFEPINPKAEQGTAIPNGGAGGVPGGMGTASAGSGFEGANSGGAAAGGYNTDVLEGERSGGGYSDPSAVSGGGGFSGYGGSGAADGFKSKFKRMDLKQYLPGGAKDPKRKLANATTSGTGHPEIAPMGVSMFKKISDRFTTMCKLKQLIGCE